jgi:hypothetical protein
MNEKRNVEAFSPQDMARRRKRSVVMAIVLGVLMLLFFITTIVRLGGNVFDRAL